MYIIRTTEILKHSASIRRQTVLELLLQKHSLSVNIVTRLQFLFAPVFISMYCCIRNHKVIQHCEQLHMDVFYVSFLVLFWLISTQKLVMKIRVHELICMVRLAISLSSVSCTFSVTF